MVGMAGRGLVGVAVAIVLGALLARAGGVGGEQVLGVPVVAWCAVVAFGLNWVAFVPAYLLRTERFYDLTGTLTYLALVAMALVWGTRSATAGVLAVLVTCWALRLGTFLVARIRRDGSDGRFDTIKSDPVRFLMTWTLQGLWVLVTAGAAITAMTTDRTPSLRVVQALGVTLWVLGFGFEVVADEQKRRFRLDPAHRDRFISSGLWAWSRHPNYFGEITLWAGVALVALPVLSGWQYVTLVSPVFVAVLLTRISGVPLLEARGRRRWGEDASYREYVARTPVLIPRPRR